MSKVILAYLAGLFDGEGCVTIASYKRKDRQRIVAYYHVRLKVSNNNKRVLSLFQETFNCGCIYPDKRKRVWEWSLSGNKSGHRVLKKLLPYLIIKRKQALLALKLERITTCATGEELAFRAKLKADISALNHE